jgi:DNA replication protein DnaC
VFDDLGAEAPSRWTLDRLYVILEERLQAGRVTIVTSNYSPSELRSYLLGAKNADAGLVQAVDRILSRLRGEFRLLPELSGVDRRRDSKGVA